MSRVGQKGEKKAKTVYYRHFGHRNREFLSPNAHCKHCNGHWKHWIYCIANIANIGNVVNTQIEKLNVREYAHYTFSLLFPYSQQQITLLQKEDWIPQQDLSFSTYSYSLEQY